MSAPIPEPDGYWPSCDDEQPGISIRPLSHADLAAVLAHLHQHDQDLDDEPLGRNTPVVAVRVRATVGRPGASAQAQYRRRRAADWAAWTRSLPWRIAGVLAAGVSVGLLAAELAPRLAGPAGLLVAAALAWGAAVSCLARGECVAAGGGRGAAHRPPAGRAGAARLGGAARPGHPRLTGQHRSSADRARRGGRGRQQAVPRPPPARPRRAAVARPPPALPGPPSGPLGGRPGRRDPRRRRRQVAAIVAVHGASIPWGRVVASGVTVAPAGRVPDLLRALPQVLVVEQVAWLADRARLAFRSAA